MDKIESGLKLDLNLEKSRLRDDLTTLDQSIKDTNNRIGTEVCVCGVCNVLCGVCVCVCVCVFECASVCVCMCKCVCVLGHDFNCCDDAMQLFLLFFSKVAGLKTVMESQKSEALKYLAGKCVGVVCVIGRVCILCVGRHDWYAVFILALLFVIIKHNACFYFLPIIIHVHACRKHHLHGNHNPLRHAGTGSTAEQFSCV